MSAACTPARGGTFHARIVAKVRREHGLKSRYERLRAAGPLTAEEVAERLDIRPPTVKKWHAAGLLRGQAYDDKNSCLFEAPGPDAPSKRQGQKLAKRRLFPEPEMASESAKEVQCEA